MTYSYLARVVLETGLQALEGVDPTGHLQGGHCLSFSPLFSDLRYPVGEMAIFTPE